MSSYDVKLDGYRYSRLQEAGFVLVGFCLGWIGIMVDWAIAHRKEQMECSAEGIYLGIIGWATTGSSPTSCTCATTRPSPSTRRRRRRGPT